MPKEKLESFKIGDTHRAGMSKPVEGRRAKSAPPLEAESTSLGFARIETMLEKDDPVEVGEGLNKILAELEELHTNGKSNKEKLAAQKAIAAVERAVDLMDYLYQTKAAMEAGVQE